MNNTLSEGKVSINKIPGINSNLSRDFGENKEWKERFERKERVKRKRLAESLLESSLIGDVYKLLIIFSCLSFVFS